MTEPWLREGIAMVLDMDGVIIDSNPLHAAAWTAYNLRFGIQTDRGMEQRMYGRRNDDIVRDYFGPHLSAAEIAEHGSAKEQLYRKMAATRLETALVPGVRELLARHSGRPVALATNAEPANVDFLLNGSGLRQYFHVIVDGHQVEHPKPHPEIYLKAAELLGIEARNCVVFEDSFSGIQAARAAGARVVGLKTTHQDLPDTDLAIDDFLSPELGPWLQAQVPRC